MQWEKLLEFLFENGFRFIARDSDSDLEAKAFEYPPSCVETEFDRIFGTISGESESRIFSIDLTEDDNLIKRGECLCIWGLLNKNDK